MRLNSTVMFEVTASEPSRTQSAGKLFPVDTPVRIPPPPPPCMRERRVAHYGWRSFVVAAVEISPLGLDPRRRRMPEVLGSSIEVASIVEMVEAQVEFALKRSRERWSD